MEVKVAEAVPGVFPPNSYGEGSHGLRCIQKRAKKGHTPPLVFTRGRAPPVLLPMVPGGRVAQAAAAGGVEGTDAAAKCPLASR